MPLLRVQTIRAALALLAVLATAPAARAQQPAAPPPARRVLVGDTTVRIILLTMGPGDEVWERFGHNAVWVHDPEAGTDLAYNYGMFDFRQHNFVLNFARGRMLYWMQGFDAARVVEQYQYLNRTVWAQELNLTREQAHAVRDFLVWNARDANRYYRYDYYRDNCSTRVRDVLDRVLGGALKRQSAAVSSGVSYRWHTRRLTAEGGAGLPMYTAIDMGLGPAADRPITRWEEMFLPMKLRDAVRGVRVRDAQGQAVPLVKEERILFQAIRPEERIHPPRWTARYLLVGWILALLVGLLAYRARRGGGAARLGFSLVSGAWLLFAGIGGVILLGLWAFTDHAIAYRNENVLQLSPLALPLVVLVPALAYGARWSWRWGPKLAAAVAALSVLGFVLQILPWFNQVNGPEIALAMPINVAVAWAAWYLSGAPPRRDGSPRPGRRAKAAAPV